MADKSDHLSRLYDKMLEEMEEFKENPCVEEAADMLEVINGLCHIYGSSMVSVIDVSTIKRFERGSFNKGIVLEEVKK